MIYRDREGIEDQRSEAEHVAMTEGSRVPAMSYEEGVRDALAWVLGDTEELPIEKGD